MKFRTEILFSLMVVVLSLLAVMAVAISLTINQSSAREVERALANGHRAFEAMQAHRRVLLQSQTRVVAEEPRLKAAVATKDISAETLGGVVREIQESLAADVLVLVDREGAVLVDATDPSAAGRLMGDDPIVTTAFKTGEGAGVWVMGNHAYQVHAQRLEFGSAVVGLMIVGFREDSVVMEALWSQLGSSAVLLVDGSIPARSSFEHEVSDAELLATLGQLRGSKGDQRATLGGHDYLLRFSPLAGYQGAAQVDVVVLESLDRWLAPGRRLMAVVLVLLLLGGLGAVFVARLLAAKLSRPVDRLVHFAQRLARGELRDRADALGPVEIQALGQAMNTMAAELEASRASLVEKERMERELQIAAKLQTGLLPTSVAISGLVVAAEMRPASEVGGDYYDILPVSGGALIGIGDVAGHGLIAGVTMMMIQNIVGTLVRLDPQASPRSMLMKLNDVLFENIRKRLKSNEHATLTLMRYFDGGRCVFAGAHEDMLIYRAKTKRCERVATPGTWVGAMKDVQKHMVDTEIAVNEGDTMVLYSDGITEARNQGGEQFGLDRVCDLIESEHANPQLLIDRLMGSVDAWSPVREDDLTLVILHRPLSGAAS